MLARCVYRNGWQINILKPTLIVQEMGPDMYMVVVGLHNNSNWNLFSEFSELMVPILGATNTFLFEEKDPDWF